MHVMVDLMGAVQLHKVDRHCVTPEQAYIVLYTCYTCMATGRVYLDIMVINKTEDFFHVTLWGCWHHRYIILIDPRLPRDFFSDPNIGLRVRPATH